MSMNNERPQFQTHCHINVMVSLSLNFVTRSALRSSAGRAEGRRGETLQRDLPGGGLPPREGHMDKG